MMKYILYAQLHQPWHRKSIILVQEWKLNQLTLSKGKGLAQGPNRPWPGDIEGDDSAAVTSKPLPTTGLNQAANKSFAEDSDSYDCFIADTSPPTASPHSNSRIETEALRLGNIQPSLVGSGKKRLLS